MAEQDDYKHQLKGMEAERDAARQALEFALDSWRRCDKERQQLKRELRDRNAAKAPDPVSVEVAETTAYVHVEGKGLNPELEGRFEQAKGH